jgi:hypothetical protein
MCQLMTFGELSNIVDSTEKVQPVLWLEEMQCLTTLQRHFRTQYGRQPPTRKIIRFWYNKLRTIAVCCL